MSINYWITITLSLCTLTQSDWNIPSRPLGEVLSGIMRPNRNGPLPPNGPPPRRKKFSKNDRLALQQDEVQEFFPPKDKNVRHQRPSRRPGPKRPKRRPENGPPPKGFTLKNPFKELLDKSPLRHKNRLPSKGGNFRPPSKVFKGFAPSFEGSLSLEEARRQYEKEKFENSHPSHHQNPDGDRSHYDNTAPSPFDDHMLDDRIKNPEKHFEMPRKKR